MKLRRLPDAYPTANAYPTADAYPAPDSRPAPDGRPVSRDPADSSQEFTLGQVQAADWVRLLEPLAEAGTGVARLRDDLEDALRLATWSRRQVRIELATSQIGEVLGTLVANSERFGQHQLDVLGEILLTFSDCPTSS